MSIFPVSDSAAARERPAFEPYRPVPEVFRFSHIQSGKVTDGAPPRQELFGWPCRLEVELDSGSRAYVLDFGVSTLAPSELRCKVGAGLGGSLGWERPVRVQVVSVFRKLVVVRMEADPTTWAATAASEPDSSAKRCA